MTGKYEICLEPVILYCVGCMMPATTRPGQMISVEGTPSQQMMVLGSNYAQKKHMMFLMISEEKSLIKLVNQSLAFKQECSVMMTQRCPLSTTY